ncbi:MAG: hypothetical protein KF680_05160 [Cryobacterium sp.]|nr:hypothetical protein [Cryobacterium sp.]
MDNVTLTVIVDAAAILWALFTLLQVVDVVTGRQLRRAGRAVGTRDRDRLFAWTIICCAIVLILVMFGVIIASRLILDHAQPWFGAALMVGLAGVSAASAILAVRALRRPESGYATLLERLRAADGTRVPKGRVKDFRRWLEAIDERETDVRRTVMLGRWVRSVPPVTGLVLVLAGVLLWLGGAVDPWVPLLSIAAPVISIVLSTLGARMSLARNLAVHAVHQKQRAEIVEAIDDLERRAPRKATGLTDRVSRALAILREQQNPGQQ